MQQWLIRILTPIPKPHFLHFITLIKGSHLLKLAASSNFDKSIMEGGWGMFVSHQREQGVPVNSEQGALNEMTAGNEYITDSEESCLTVKVSVEMLMEK